MASRLVGLLRHNAVAFLALSVALGGTSYAVTTKKFVGSDGRVNACVKTKTGSARLVVKATRCRKGEQRVTWSQRGPAGAPGAAGQAGAPGPAGSIQGVAAGGDLTGSYPAPTIAPAPAPVSVAENPVRASDPCGPSVAPETMVLCGTSSQYWQSGGFGLPGLQVSRDQIGQVHIRGSATLSAGTTSSSPSLFVLPEAQRPKRILAFTVATSNTAGATATGSALLVVYPGDTGVVAVFNPSTPTQRVVHLGDITFRTDA